jgi:hypothetical protein
MDIVLSGLSFDICLAYLDNIIVFSEDESSHNNKLRVVLSRLQQAGLKLKPSKMQPDATVCLVPRPRHLSLRNCYRSAEDSRHCQLARPAKY